MYRETGVTFNRCLKYLLTYVKHSYSKMVCMDKENYASRSVNICMVVEDMLIL